MPRPPGAVQRSMFLNAPSGSGRCSRTWNAVTTSKWPSGKDASVGSPTKIRGVTWRALAAASGGPRGGGGAPAEGDGREVPVAEATGQDRPDRGAQPRWKPGEIGIAGVGRVARGIAGVQAVRPHPGVLVEPTASRAAGQMKPPGDAASQIPPP